MYIKNRKKQDFICRSNNNKILLHNNLYKPSAYILLYFNDKSKYKQVMFYE